jgi:hypothetical protein
VDLFEIVDRESGEVVPIKEYVFESPESYDIRLIGFEGKENNLAELHVGKILGLGFQSRKIDDSFDIRAPRALRICGDRDGALLLAERIRSFTHRFAIDLITDNRTQVEAAFSKNINSKYSAGAMLEKIARLERDFGRFAHFDYVEVITVYNGEHADIDKEESIPVPRGMGRSVRRGQSRLSLVSVWTPNGVAIYEYLLDLFIIEEDGVFRLSGFHLRSGY